MVKVPSRLFSSVRRYERVGDICWRNSAPSFSSSSWLRYRLISYRSSRSDSIRLLLSAFAGGLPTSGRADRLTMPSQSVLVLAYAVRWITNTPTSTPSRGLSCLEYTRFPTPFKISRTKLPAVISLLGGSRFAC